MAESKEMTPLMKQYWSVKTAHPDKIVLFRMGDFFEMFHDDAIEAAPLLGIALTLRNKKSGDQTPMCGVPHHSIGGQINKLLQAGRKVAICDQVEDPKLAKGLVQREVTRILTPGMVYDPETLDSQAPNYMACWRDQHLAFLEATTGECFYYRAETLAKAQALCEQFKPVEILLPNEESCVAWSSLGGLDRKATLTVWTTYHQRGQGEPLAAQTLLAYVAHGQGEASLVLYGTFTERSIHQQMEISAKVLQHLEVFLTSRGEKRGSLFHTINRTRTAGGSRLLRQWLSFPLAEKSAIEERHQQIETWTTDFTHLKEVRILLDRIGDLERRLGRLAQPNPHPRDLKVLAESVRAAGELVAWTKSATDQAIFASGQLQSWAQRVESAFVEEIPANCREGGFIQKGFSPALDEWIELSENSQDKIRALEERERQATGISSLKIRYNNVFGFYIEITNTHRDKVPVQRYQRKQTLANAERFCTEELNELERKVVSAKSRRSEVEWELFAQFRHEVMDRLSEFLKLAGRCNHLDVCTALAWLALQDNYVRPHLQEGSGLELLGSRHPVVEALCAGQFIANDIHIKPNQCMLLTGPNMAGKSTLMRQVALSVLLAQAGCFVPARSAQLPVVDKIFTRIGAGDHLSEGLSTFMVEMQETAEMLNRATANSLVVLDEVGRGTSTYDGLSLAQAILEYFIADLKSFTLFATHYHELTALETQYPELLLNRHMAIHEEKGRLFFRYHLAEGPAHKSYGLQVAKLAGVPKSVVSRAQSILGLLQRQQGRFESAQLDLFAGGSIDFVEPSAEPESAAPHPLIESLKEFDLQKTTPLEALNQIAKWQQELS